MSLLGDADFHALTSVKGTVTGWNSADGALMASDDMREWEIRARGLALLDVAPAPDEPATLVAGIPVSQTKLTVQRSTNGGRTSTDVDRAPQLARFAWPERRELFGFDLEGAVWFSADDGETWQRRGTVGALPEAVSATPGAPGTLLAAADGAVQESTDGGRTWKVLHQYGK